MSYQYFTQWTSTFTGPAMTPKGITIHWWGLPGQTGDFAGTASYLVQAGYAQRASVHYVAEAGKVACLISPNIASWGNGDGGNGWGNLNTITIECNPRNWEADRETVAELIANLRKTYGDLPLYPHNRWTATQCPGTWEAYLPWLSNRANQIMGGAKPAAPVSPSPAPAPAGNANTRIISQSVAWVRTAPSTGASLAPGYPAGIAKGATLAVVGYVGGQDPFNSGDNAWLKTKSGFYVWANAAGNDLSGLKYLGEMIASKPTAPAKPAPAPVTASRVVTAPVAYVRTAPRSTASTAPGYPNGIAKGATLAIVGYVAGEDPYKTGDDAWLKTKSGFYVWANNAGNSLSGLKKLN